MTIQARRKWIEVATAGAYPTEADEQAAAEYRAFLATLPELITPAVHFVGFKGDEYISAVRVFGRPDFIHRNHDIRLVRGGELHPVDTVVFANGSEKAMKLDATDDSNIDVQAFEKAERKAGRA
jgi:hypothetical protein